MSNLPNRLKPKSSRSRAARRPARNKSGQVQIEPLIEGVYGPVVVWGEPAQYLQNLVSEEGRELRGDRYNVFALNAEEAGKLATLTAPINFRVSGRDWVLRHTEKLGWFLEPLL